MGMKKQTVEEEVSGLFRDHYRLATSGWVGGENRITVVRGNDPKAYAISRTVWHHKHAWSGTDLDVLITISPSWRRSIRARGLAVLDGLLTTHAGLISRNGEFEAYPATWVRQGRGLSIRAESGWVAFHRPSPDISSGSRFVNCAMALLLVGFGLTTSPNPQAPRPPL